MLNNKNVIIFSSWTFLYGLAASVTFPYNYSDSTSQPNESDISPEDTISIVNYCIQQQEILKCFKKQAVIALESIIHSNDAWYINDYVSLQKDPKWNDESLGAIVSNETNLDDVLKNRINSLAQSRMLQFKTLPFTHDTEDDDENTEVTARKGGIIKFKIKKSYVDHHRM